VIRDHNNARRVSIVSWIVLGVLFWAKFHCPRHEKASKRRQGVVTQFKAEAALLLACNNFLSFVVWQVKRKSAVCACLSGSQSLLVRSWIDVRGYKWCLEELEWCILWLGDLLIAGAARKSRTVNALKLPIELFIQWVLIRIVQGGSHM